MNEEAVVQHSAGKRFQVCFGAWPAPCPGVVTTADAHGLHASTVYAEAGQPLKEEQPPQAAQAAQADEEDGGEPAWVPPPHVLDSDGEADELGEEAEEEAEELLGADDNMDEEEVLPIVARPNPPKRKATEEPRLKKLHKHSVKKRGTDKRA